MEDLVEAINHVTGGETLVTGQQNAKAQEQRNDDDLEHGGVGQRRNCIGGEDGHDGVHNTLALGRRIFQIGGSQRGEQMEALGDAGQHQGQSNCKCGGAHIVHNGLAAHGADLLNVAHGNHTGGDGEQHNGNHHEFQQVQEDGAEGLNVAFREIYTVGDGHQDQAGHNAHAQADKDPKCQRKLLFVQMNLSFFFAEACMGHRFLLSHLAIIASK